MTLNAMYITLSAMTTIPAPAELPVTDLTDLYHRHLHGHRFDEPSDTEDDVIIGHRAGGRFEDRRSGRWLWNCHCNGGVFNFGHRNPAVIAAVTAALDEVDIGNHHTASPWRAVAAQRLSATTGGTHPGVVFSASGAEANELAMKLALLHTGRRGIVVAEDCFHGTTLATLATLVSLMEAAGLGRPEVTAVPWDNLGAMEAALTGKVGLVLLESIPATSGFPLPAPGYLAGVRERCRANGTLLALDEVQTGLGRTGQVWSYQHDSVVPDMIITGKGLSGGIMPIAATLLSPDLFETWSSGPGMHVSTFGGGEIACAAAIAVCDLLDDALLAHVRSVSALFRSRLAGQRFGFRGRGLVMALTTDDRDGARGTWRRLRDAGIYTYPAAFTSDTVQLKPPLTTSAADADAITAAVIGALG
jgi:putrescine aminotransferase